MAVNPLVQGPTPTAPVATSLDAAAVLSALKTGQAVDAVVLAKLETGEARLATLGILLDIMPVEPVDLGDALRLTVVRTGDDLAVSVAKAPLPDRQGLPPASAPPADTRPRAGAPSGSPPSTSAAQPSRADVVELSPAAGRIFAAQAAEVSPHEAGRLLSDPLLSDPSGSDPLRAPEPSAQAKAALAAMIPAAAAGQQSRAPLVANAIAVLAGPAGDRLPKAVRESLSALVSSAIDPTRLDGAALRGAVARSGTFQEGALLRITGTVDADVDPTGDAKSAILALRSVLQALVGREGGPAVLARPDPPPLPQRGAPAVAQQAAAPSLAADATPHLAARTLLDGAEGALDRIRLLQSASLPDDRAAASAQPGADRQGQERLILDRPTSDRPTSDRQASERARTDRLVEIPIAMSGGRVPVASLAIGRDGRSAAMSGEAPAWRMKLSLDLEETGPMHAVVSLRGARAGVTLWAERPQTADLFRSSLGELRDALTVADLDIDTLDVRTGAPTPPRPAPAGSFLDRRT